MEKLKLRLAPFTWLDFPPNADLDPWVAEHFRGKRPCGEIMATLNQCSLELRLCEDVRRRLRERSPTALALTLQLLRANEGRPLPEIFHREALAAHFMITHPDYLEGIRARIIDKDDQPRWQPVPRKLADHGGRFLIEGLRPLACITKVDFTGGPMSYQTILFDHEADVATITFNRPDKLNALNQRVLVDALNRVRRDRGFGCSCLPGPAGPSSPARTSRFSWILTP